MSTFTHHTMTNHHGFGIWQGITETFRVWHHRWVTRRELLEWSERDMHDAGVSWSEIAAEADKPFWRA